jgi:hypothetical protein
MTNFINPKLIKISEYPSNFIPANSIVINQTDENNECTVKGFYDPITKVYHIQEISVKDPREELKKQFNEYCPEYSEYLMANVTTEAVICNGDTLIDAMEKGILYEEFIDSML